MKRQGIDDAAFDNIDWDILEQATRRWYKGRSTWISKAMAGSSPTGRVMMRRKKWVHDKCPRCDEEDEDTIHVMQCSDPSTKKCWKELIQQLCVDMIILRWARPSLMQYAGIWQDGIWEPGFWTTLPQEQRRQLQLSRGSDGDECCLEESANDGVTSRKCG